MTDINVSSEREKKKKGWGAMTDINVSSKENNRWGLWLISMFPKRKTIVLNLKTKISVWKKVIHP